MRARTRSFPSTLSIRLAIRRASQFHRLWPRQLLSTGSGCNGLSAPGGQGTYYAQVIYTAQAALAMQQASNPTSKNIMIILSDGDATACALNANTSAGGCNSAAQIVAENNPTCAGKTGGSCLNGTGTSATNPNTTETESSMATKVPPTRRRWASAGRRFRRRNWQRGGNRCLYDWFRVGDFRVHIGQNVHHNLWFDRWRRGVAGRHICQDALQRDCGNGF